MLVVNHDATRAYTSNVHAGTVSVIDLNEKKVLAVIQVSSTAQRISLSADGRWVFTADQTAPRLAMIDTATNQLADWVSLPGIAYGWPKNVLHQKGIQNSIIDINATVPFDLAIVDGVVGMEGDGPIRGTPRPTNVLVMGTSLPAVDATCARIMGLNVGAVDYLLAASRRGLGPIRAEHVEQRGAPLADVRGEFALPDVGNMGRYRG